MLSEAAPTTEKAAQLASGQMYDWDLAAPRFATVSGASTSTPAAPSTALTAAEQAEWESLTARFGAPATRATTLARLGSGNAAILAFQVGLLVGQGSARLVGFKDDQVCSQRSVGLTVAASVLDGVDCNAYNNAMTAVERDADQLPSSSFDALNFMGTSTTYDYGVPGRGTYNWLTCFNITGKVPDGYKVAVDVWGAADTFNSSSSAESNSDCRPQPSNLSGGWIKAPLSKFRVLFYDMYTNKPLLESPIVDATSYSTQSPERYFRCTIWNAAFSYSWSASTDTFRETDPTLPSPVCPQIPAGTIVGRQSIEEVTGTATTATADSDATAAYLQWANGHPECKDGSCPTALFKNGVNCFFTADPDECDGWVTDPNRESTFTCKAGTQTVAISECFIYGQLFNTANRDSGHAYADPSTGSPVSTQTSPTRLDRLTRALSDRGDNSWVTWQANAVATGNAQTESSIGNTARALARQCVALGVTDDECTKLPIFAPGSDIEQAATHDLDAIRSQPAWAQLNFADPGSRGESGWYRNTPPCVAGSYPTADDPGSNPPIIGQQCDEYPYLSSQQGGPGKGVSLRPIASADNRNEGIYLRYFYSSNGCNVQTPSEHNPERAYLVLPTPTTHTSMWCNTPGQQ